MIKALCLSIYVNIMFAALWQLAAEIFVIL